MNSQPRQLVLPRRHTLSEQAAAAVRQAIEQNTWKEYLPSERRLCELLQVSRPTIRTALQMLAREGRLEIRHGRRNRLLSSSHPRTKPKSRLVVLITHEPISHVTMPAYQGIAETRAHLAEHGFTTEVLVCPLIGARAQQKKLETFVRQNPVLCCVLLSVSKELQEWFATHSIPALVLGSCHAAVRLPSLDVDYRSLCRHAAGILRGKGHRRLAFVVPNSGVAGDLASEEGFREGGATQAAGDASEAIVLRHNGTATNLAAKLDALFASADPPTALLVAKPQHVFIVIIYLLQRGIRVPDTVSLIARDYDHIFEIVSPPIAHYSFREDTYAHRLTRLMLKMVRQGDLPPERSLIFPKYFPGGTVKQSRSANL
jgi:DNA-binding LacI/PurR family transcriptional regulator